MAISDDLPGVSITIAVNGTPLQEHNPAEVDGEHLRTVTKYVEVTSGQLFAVSIKLLPAFKFKGGCIVFEIYADGDLMSKPMFIKYNSDRSKVAKGRPSGHDKVEKFRFADVQTGEANPANNQKTKARLISSQWTTTASSGKAQLSNISVVSSSNVRTRWRIRELATNI